jgi:hypothetical protein
MPVWFSAAAICAAQPPTVATADLQKATAATRVYYLPCWLDEPWLVCLALLRVELKIPIRVSLYTATVITEIEKKTIGHELHTETVQRLLRSSIPRKPMLSW